MDLGLVRDKLNRMKAKNITNKLIWRPKPGTYTIRIVPYLHNKEFPFQELYFHYSLNGKHWLSPITVGKDDPIYEFAQSLMSSGDKEDFKLGRKLKPTLRVYAPIVIRGEENQGIKFWAFGKEIYGELLSFISDPECGDITDPVKGRDITVEVKSAKETGSNYGSTKIRLKLNTSKLSESAPTLQTILLEQPKLIPDIFAIPEYETLKEELSKYINGGGNSTNTSQSGENVEEEKDNDEDIEEENKSSDDILKEFNNLMNQTK